MSTATEIRERYKKRPRGYESIEFEGDTLWLQTLSDLEASSALALCIDRKTSVFDQGRHSRELIIRAWVANEGGERIYKDGEQKEIAELPARLTQSLIRKIEQMNGSVDLGKKPDDSTETDASS